MTVKPTYCVRICKSSIRYRNELRKLSYSIDCLLGTTRYSPRRQTSSQVPSPGEQRNIRLVIDSAQFAPLCENMTSSTEPDVHNVLHCCQRRTEPRPHVTTYTYEIFVKFWHVVFEIRELTDNRTDEQTVSQTDRYADCNTLHRGATLKCDYYIFIHSMFSRLEACYMAPHL